VRVASACGVLSLLPLAGEAPAAGPSDAADGGQQVSSLQREKLRAEIEQLEAEAGSSAGVRGFLATVAAPLTGLAAFGAVVVSVIGFRREKKQQREEQETAREQHLEERFAGVLFGLGSDSEAIQASSAVSLSTFLGEQHRRFHRQVRMATLANLKVKHTPTVRMLLLRAFEDSLRTPEPLGPAELDLSHASLAGASLQGLALDRAKFSQVDLRGADLSNCSMVAVKGRGAHLGSARLSGSDTNLQNARLAEADAPEANFGGANLVNVHFEGGDFRGASFRGARLQAAHLERCRLEGASFDGADVADTYFVDASFDQESLESLAKVGWEQAHLAPDVEESLRSL